MLKLYSSYSVIAALCAAFLFGASTPLAKQLVGNINPVLLAGLVYLGSGIGLFVFRITKNKGWPASGLSLSEWFWFLGAIVFGGILGPLLLMLGLTYTSAAHATLLLNLEAALTAFLAWIFFKEHTDKKIIIGMIFIVIGGILLAMPHHTLRFHWFGSMVIALACLCWAIDNNLTRKISNAEALFIASTKGLIAGIVNISIAFIIGVTLPKWIDIGYSLIIGLMGYGISLVLFVIALRGLGTARTGAYFSTAPFIGAAIAILFFHDSTSIVFWSAAALMIIGVWLHLSERHDHWHNHEEVLHNHHHTHDEHHQHAHDFPCDNKKAHSHLHYHKALAHKHPHYPDTHHRHSHNK